jgi:hypothetical protein
MMTSFVSAHGIMFTRGSILAFKQFGAEFISHLENQAGWIESRWREQGVEIASANFAAMLEYGNPDGVLMKLLSESIQSNAFATSRFNFVISRFFRAIKMWRNWLMRRCSPFSIKFFSSMELLSYTTYFTFRTLSLVLKHIGDDNVLPHVHVSLAFLWSLALVPEAMTYVQAEVPWRELVYFLNSLNREGVNESRLESDEFPLTDSGTISHLSEDSLMLGQVWSRFHPPDFFNDLSIDDEERSLELPSTAVLRIERCLWLGRRLASVSLYILIVFRRFD